MQGTIGSSLAPRARGTARLSPGAVACKCQICICGVHKCPSSGHLFPVHPSDPTCMTSNYQQSYPPHQVRGPPSSMAPQPNLNTNNLPFEGASTHKTDFVPWSAKPSSSYKPASGLTDTIGVPIGGKDDRAFLTEARNQYDPKGRVVTQPFVPDNRQSVRLPFEGESTHKSDFPRWTSAKPSTPFKANTAAAGAPEDRDFQTEAALKFTNHGVQRRQPFVQQHKLRASVPFEGESTHKTDYPVWQGAPARSCAPSTTLSHQPDDRDFKSTTSDDFGPKGLVHRASCAPKNDVHATNLPFEGASTNKTDFVPWSAKPSSSYKPASGLTDTIGVPIGGKDDRAFLTEARNQYDPKGRVVTQPFVPDNRQSVRLPFEGESTHKSDFPRWTSAKPSTPFKANTAAAGAPEDRDFQTEAALKFTNHGVQRRQPFVQQHKLRASVPFEGESTQKSDYQAWKQEPCPAFALPDGGIRGADGHLKFVNTGANWEPVA